MIKEKIVKIFLLLFFLLSLFLRLYQLGTNPEALNWDEAALGYNSYSLLKTSRDEYGYKLPLVLRSFDDYKPALYSYLTIPFIALWGLNIFSVRFVSAVFGALMIFSMYIFVRNVFKSRFAGLTASLITVFSPLFLVYSRTAAEGNLSLGFFTFGLAFITYSKNMKRFLLGMFFLLLSTYAYHAARYLAPLVVLIATLGLKNVERKTKFRIIFLFAVLFLPILYIMFNPLYNVRFGRVSLFTNLSSLTGSLITLTNPMVLPEKIIRSYFFLLDFAGRFLQYFNPYTLFFKTTGNDQIILREFGVFNLVELPFWLVGITALIRRIRKINPVFSLGIIAAALPPAVTVDWFSPLRASLLWPFFIGLTAYGVFQVFSKANIFLKMFAPMVFLAWLFFAGLIMENIFVYRTYAYAGIYQYGFAQVVPYVDELIKQNNYKNVIVETHHAQPHIFYLFFSAYPPERYQKETNWRAIDYVTDRHNFDFGPFIFRNIYWPDDGKLENSLFVGGLENLSNDILLNSPNAKLLQDFTSPDGNNVARVVETD